MHNATTAHGHNTPVQTIPYVGVRRNPCLLVARERETSVLAQPFTTHDQLIRGSAAKRAPPLPSPPRARTANVVRPTKRVGASQFACACRSNSQPKAESNHPLRPVIRPSHEPLLPWLVDDLATGRFAWIQALAGARQYACVLIVDNRLLQKPTGKHSCSLGSDFEVLVDPRATRCAVPSVDRLRRPCRTTRWHGV